MTPQQKLTLPEQAATQAELIVNNIQHTYYQHKLSIDVDRGIYDCDCNGFVSFVLERSAPDHYAMIPKEKDQLRPRAFEYHDFLASLTQNGTDGWQRVEFMRHVRRGDIVAWRFPVIKLHHDTGHVVFAAESPVEESSGTFSLRVYDSAAQAHFDDTRGTGDGEFATGVGTGVINFEVDDAGRPTAFQFAPGDHFEHLPIAMGRLRPFRADN